MTRLSIGALLFGLGLLALAAIPSARADGNLIFTDPTSPPTPTTQSHPGWFCIYTGYCVSDIGKCYTLDPCIQATSDGTNYCFQSYATKERFATHQCKSSAGFAGSTKTVRPNINGCTELNYKKCAELRMGTGPCNDDQPGGSVIRMFAWNPNECGS